MRYFESIPDWMSFSFRNRSVYGVPPEEGVFRVDIQYMDDSLEEALINFKITVLRRPDEDLTPIYIMAIVTFSISLSVATFFAYVISFCRDLGKKEPMNRNKLKLHKI